MKPIKNNKEKNKKEAPVVTPSPDKVNVIVNDPLRTNLAIGTITLFISVLFLYLLNYIVYTTYDPDINAILDKLVTISFVPRHMFSPEPVERMQFQLSLILTPFIIYAVFAIVNKKKKILNDSPSAAMLVNILGIVAFIAFALLIFSKDLLYIENETTSYFFANDVIRIFNPVLVLILFGFFSVLIFLFYKSKETPLKKIITNVISFGLVLFVATDIVLYNVFHLGALDSNGQVETNAVFYSVTQVLAGKSLLVDINSQYGLFAWLLSPLFKLAGFSVYKFAITMGVLNGISYLLLYLGIKKLIKNDLLPVIIFLCVVFWQYWQTRIPLGAVSRNYFQYWPIRLLFPSLLFFLLSIYQTTAKNIKNILLPVITLSSSVAVLWNLDSGVVVFGATLIALVVSTLDAPSVRDIVKRSVYYASLMFGSFLFVLLVFMFSTKIHSGEWPDFKLFFEFQNLFYVSGFTMLPMSPIHFWNLPVLVYLVTCIYCVYNLRKTNQQDLPVIVFLFILGGGIFTYFQGRSYDTNVTTVMYPAIILAGIFCNKLLLSIQSDYFRSGRIRFHESMVLFIIPFLFLADGAFSMIWHTPAIHSFAVHNATKENPEKENPVRKKIAFIANNIKQKDTVLIFARDYESYYYAAGNYYNPLNLSGSTELFLWTELYKPVDFIKNTKYPIIFDNDHPQLVQDTIIKTLAKYTTIEKTFGDDRSLLLLKPGKKQVPGKLTPGPNTIYYNDLGDFNRYTTSNIILQLPENFMVELYIVLDSSKLAKGNILFTNATTNAPSQGIAMLQNGDDLTQYVFTYGNGSEWCSPVSCKLSCTGENHIVIKVQKNIITVYNNNILCGQANTGSSIKNSEGKFKINHAFSGTVEELMISNQ